MQIGSKKAAAVINVTPLIDVLLVLLITFMLLPYHSKGLPAEAAQSAPDSQQSQPKVLNVVLRIRGDRSIDIDSHPVALPDVGARLQSLFAVRPGGALFIRGDPQLEFADIASVIDVARGAGVGRIGLITEREEQRQLP